MGFRPRKAAPLAKADQLSRAIQEVLDEDRADGARLMLKKYRDLVDDSLGGYCTIATEAYFFLYDTDVRDPRDGGDLQPMRRGYEDDTSHWWLLRKSDGALIDLTVRPGDTTDADAADYEDGKPRGFMQHGYQRPSKRAQELMNRVQALRSRPNLR
jgi:hypothetical protein